MEHAVAYSEHLRVSSSGNIPLRRKVSSLVMYSERAAEAHGHNCRRHELTISQPALLLRGSRLPKENDEMSALLELQHCQGRKTCLCSLLT